MCSILFLTEKIKNSLSFFTSYFRKFLNQPISINILGLLVLVLRNKHDLLLWIKVLMVHLHAPLNDLFLAISFCQIHWLSFFRYFALSNYLIKLRFHDTKALGRIHTSITQKGGHLVPRAFPSQFSRGVPCERGKEGHVTSQSKL